MTGAATSVERDGTTAIVHVHGDLVIPTVRELHETLYSLQRRRDVKKVVLDLAGAAQLDSSGVAVIEVARRSLERSGKELAIEQLGDRQRAAFELAPPPTTKPTPIEPPKWLEAIGDRVLNTYSSARGAGRLFADVVAQSAAVATRRRRLPAGSIASHVLTMGADAVFVVGLLSFLLGLTTAFQGIVQLTKFGAGVLVADVVGWSMVRELAPLVAAIVLSGRTGAAIAAELGAMRIGEEIDALTAMGVSPIRFLVVPRLVALTIALPALTLIAMFVGICGGMFVAVALRAMSPSVFWMRITSFVDMADFLQGFSKSFVFAWIIGLTGSHLGLRTSGDASSVGAAATRTVVVSIFFIIVVDAAFATAITLWRQS